MRKIDPIEVRNLFSENLIETILDLAWEYDDLIEHATEIANKRTCKELGITQEELEARLEYV